MAGLVQTSVQIKSGAQYPNKKNIDLNKIAGEALRKPFFLAASLRASAPPWTWQPAMSGSRIDPEYITCAQKTNATYKCASLYLC